MPLKGEREVEPFAPPTVLLYGPTGAGKTYLASSASMVEDLCPVCLIAMARTDATLVDKKDIDLDKITLLDPKAYMKQANLSNEWDASAQLIRSVRDLKPFRFKCVILDDLSVLQYYAEDRAKEITPFHKDGGSVLLELTQQGDYRLARSRIITAVLDLMDACIANGAMFIMTTKERLIQLPPEGDQDPDSLKVYKFSPALMPSLIEDMTGAADIVGKLRAISGSSVLETRRTPYRDAKDRYGLIGDSMKDPTMAKIMEKLRGKNVQKTDVVTEVTN